MINNVTNTSIAVFNNCNSSDKSLIANAATEILAAKSERRYAAFINNSPVKITLVLGETNKTALNKGIVLNPGGSYEINANNLYVGAVSAIAQTACKLIFVECVE